MTGHQIPEDATTPQLNLAAITARLDARTPIERVARQARHDFHAIGLAAMRLGEEYLVRGDLDAAHDWFTLAAQHHALDAATMVGRVTALREAADSPELAHTAANSPLANNGAHGGKRDITQDRLETAADLILDAHNTAIRVVADARTTAEDILASAHTFAQDTALLTETSTGEADGTHLVGHPRGLALKALLARVMAKIAPAAEPSAALPAHPNDLAIEVALAISGDRPAVERLLSSIHPLVVRYCRARLGRQEHSFAAAEDVAQDVCLAVLAALPTYRDQGRPFMSFVYGIAAHKVADAHRTSGRNRSEPIADVPDSPETEAGPEQRALRGELSREMVELLKTLPDKRREILLLRVVVGLSAEETAIAVGSTPGAVRVAQHRALAELRKLVTTEQPEDGPEPLDSQPGREVSGELEQPDQVARQ